MTSKQKADKIYESYRKQLSNAYQDRHKRKYRAVQCSLISINEQIRYIEEEMIQVNYDLRKIWIDELIEVKLEIQSKIKP